MELYLIRHTTPDIEKGICYGQSDIPVTQNFLKEAQHLKSNLPILDDTFLVYSSPLTRCKQLVEEISQTTITYDDRLKELNFGDWEMQKWNAINENELQIWMKDFVHIKTTNGESYIDLNNRVLDFFKSIPNDQCIAIVTHAGVIRSILALLNKVPLKDSFKYSVDYGEVIHLNSDDLFKQLIK